jgi:hypothetical protein
MARNFKTPLLWLGLVVSAPASLYSCSGVVFYSWLNAAEPDRWPTERAAIWVLIAAALTALFLGLFIYCMASLRKVASKNS